MASPDTSPYFTGFTNGPGLSSVGSYQIAGTPWLSSSTLPAGGVLEVRLPAVSKRIVIYNNEQATPSTSLAVSFRNPNDTGVATLGHTFVLSDQISKAAAPGLVNHLDMEIKCSSFWITNMNGAATLDWQGYAELTGIAPNQMFELSGTGINDV